jgi:hypothetical protein
LSSPVFQAWLIGWAKHEVDLGADGVLVDDTFAHVTEILSAPLAAGCFDSVTMAAFTAWLQQT